jgi:hypothetical protein
MCCDEESKIGDSFTRGKTQFGNPLAQVSHYHAIEYGLFKMMNAEQAFLVPTATL